MVEPVGQAKMVAHDFLQDDGLIAVQVAAIVQYAAVGLEFMYAAEFLAQQPLHGVEPTQARQYFVEQYIHVVLVLDVPLFVHQHDVPLVVTQVGG